MNVVAATTATSLYFKTNSLYHVQLHTIEYLIFLLNRQMTFTTGAAKYKLIQILQGLLCKSPARVLSKDLDFALQCLPILFTHIINFLLTTYFIEYCSNILDVCTRNSKSETWLKKLIARGLKLSLEAEILKVLN